MLKVECAFFADDAASQTRRSTSRFRSVQETRLVQSHRGSEGSGSVRGENSASAEPRGLLLLILWKDVLIERT